jgi:hypothetical protein
VRPTTGILCGKAAVRLRPSTYLITEVTLRGQTKRKSWTCPDSVDSFLSSLIGDLCFVFLLRYYTRSAVSRAGGRSSELFRSPRSF